MSGRGFKSFIIVCISAIVLFFGIAVNTSFSLAWNVISNLTHFVPFIITGIICLICGINERKYGSIIFGTATVVLFAFSMS